MRSRGGASVGVPCAMLIGAVPAVGHRLRVGNVEQVGRGVGGSATVWKGFGTASYEAC